VYKNLTRTALLLALALLFQSLRFFLPVPPAFSTFLIGSLVNMALLVAALEAGVKAAVFIGLVVPVVAYLQQLLPVPFFILPVACGNTALIFLFQIALRFGALPAILLAATGKAVIVYGLFIFVLTFIDLPPQAAAALLFAMGWGQLVTGCLGGFLAVTVHKKLRGILS
jgi:hypothetical protein